MSEYNSGEQVGNEGDKDSVYAERFWDKQSPTVRDGLREAMVQGIKSASESGTMGIFVNPTGLTERDKEKLSAYRLLAGELGFKVGKFTFNKNAILPLLLFSKKDKKLHNIL